MQEARGYLIIVQRLKCMCPRANCRDSRNCYAAMTDTSVSHSMLLLNVRKPPNPRKRNRRQTWKTDLDGMLDDRAWWMAGGNSAVEFDPERVLNFYVDTLPKRIIVLFWLLLRKSKQSKRNFINLRRQN